jgi:hypothetical protein
MPFVDHACSHQRNGAACGLAECVPIEKGSSTWVSIVSAATATSGRPGKATAGSFNALINATASYCLILVPTTRVAPTKNPAFAGLSESG